MKNISQEFNVRYQPKTALLIYENNESSENIYVESYEISRRGKPINAHPLSVKEMQRLSEIFQSAAENKTDYLKPAGIFPASVLHIDAQGDGYALWYTPAQTVNLFFRQDLTIPCGRAQVPAMLWKANRNALSVFALKSGKKPALETPLYHAPFFNTDSSGNVCMGSVDIDIQKQTTLDNFMLIWQNYFFGSYFSHLRGMNPVKVNIVQLWTGLISQKKQFPSEVLIKSSVTIKSLIA